MTAFTLCAPHLFLVGLLPFVPSSVFRLLSCKFYHNASFFTFQEIYWIVADVFLPGDFFGWCDRIVPPGTWLKLSL